MKQYKKHLHPLMLPKWKYTRGFLQRVCKEEKKSHGTPPMRTSSDFVLTISVLILNWGDLDDNGVGRGGTNGKIFWQAFTLTVQRTSSLVVSCFENVTALFLNLLRSLFIIQRKRKPYLQRRHSSSTLLLFAKYSELHNDSCRGHYGLTKPLPNVNLLSVQR